MPFVRFVEDVNKAGRIREGAGMSRNGRPPSMADVAELVGVSHQTVSLVVNGKGRVSPRTRERVQSAIAQLGYRPNSVARALVTARSGIIGVVTTTSAHFGPSSMLIALEITAREAGFFTSVVALDRFSVEDVASAFDHFSSLAAEAIIVITPMDSLAEAVAAQGASVPVIAVSGGHVFGRGVSVVRADQRGGARELAEHLLSLGHRDIACVAGPREWFVARERMAGWREAMDEAGLPKREPLIGLWEASWGYVAGQRLVEEGLPDAIMCANDEVAVGLLHAFAEAGVSVLGDVSVAGFDDVLLAAYVGPGLTTVHQDFADLGRCTMEAVSQALEGGSVDTYVRPTHLVVGGVRPLRSLFFCVRALCAWRYERSLNGCLSALRQEYEWPQSRDVGVQMRAVWSSTSCVWFALTTTCVMLPSRRETRLNRSVTSVF